MLKHVLHSNVLLKNAPDTQSKPKYQRDFVQMVHSFNNDIFKTTYQENQMRLSVKNIACGAIALIINVPTFAADPAAEAEAIAMVKAMIEMSKKSGVEKALAACNSRTGKFNSKSKINPTGDLYGMAFNLDGVQPCHGKNAKIRGKNMIEMKDADGIPFIKNIIDQCNSSDAHGWTKYKWPHPATKKITPMATYVEKFGELCWATGIYDK